MNFSPSNLQDLENSLKRLMEILDQAKVHAYHDHLTKLLHAAQRSDERSFTALTLDNWLFGGAGALWEIYIGEEQLQRQFHEEYGNFIDILIAIGIDNRRVDQIREDMRTLAR